MNRIELYIDGQAVDLEESQKIAQTFQINEFFDISDRQANFTNRFNIPPTAHNLQVFDRLGIVGNRTRFPYKIHRVNLTLDGLPLISNGTANLKKFKDAEGYEIYIYSGVNSIFEEIGDKLLADLDFSDLNHNFELLNFINSFNNSDGYIYALFDSGKQPASGALLADTIVPAVFLKTLWDKVFTEAGFTYSGDIFSEAYFLNKLIIPNNMFSFTEGEIIGSALNARAVEFESGVGFSDPPVSETWEGVAQSVYYESIIDVFNLIDPDPGVFIDVPEAGTYDITYEIQFDLDDPILEGQMFFSYTGEGSATGNGEIIDQQSFSKTVTYRKTFASGEDFQTPILPVQGVQDPAAEGTDFTYSVKITLTKVGSQTPISFNTLFSDGLTQKEFVKDVLQKFGLLLKRTPNSSNYEFIEIKELLKDRANAKDLTGKFNRRNSQTYKIDPTAQFNYFKYKYPQDVEAFADSFIYTDNETIKEENTLIQSVMNAAQKTNKLLTPDESRKLYSVPFFVSAEGGGYDLETPGTYIFDVIRETIDLDYTVQDAPETALFSGSVPFCTFDGLSYKNIIPEFYSEYAAIVNSPVKEEIELRLDALDIYKFDFFKPIYLAQLGHYYYVEKIKDFLPGKITKLEVVKIVDYASDLVPDIGNSSGSVDSGNVYTFTTSNFLQAYVSPSGQQHPALIRIDTLPAAGTLLLDGVAVTAGQEILWTDIEAGLFTFDESGTSDFTFSIQDEGVYIYSDPATFTLTVS
jgi:hypothetical protein